MKFNEDTFFKIFIGFILVFMFISAHCTLSSDKPERERLFKHCLEQTKDFDKCSTLLEPKKDNKK